MDLYHGYDVFPRSSWPRSVASSAKTVRSVEAWAAEGPCGARLRAAANVVAAAFSISPVTCLGLLAFKKKWSIWWILKPSELSRSLVKDVLLIFLW